MRSGDAERRAGDLDSRRGEAERERERERDLERDLVSFRRDDRFLFELWPSREWDRERERDRDRERDGERRRSRERERDLETRESR